MDTDERMCQNFKQEFRKQIEFYSDKSSGLLYAYGAALNVFAKRLNNKPSSKPINATWEELMRSVLLAMTSIEQPPDTNALKKFDTLLRPWLEEKNAIKEIKENFLVLHNLAINGAWGHPIFQSLLQEEDVDVTKLGDLLLQENEEALCARLHALEQCSKNDSASKLILAAMKHKKFRESGIFQQTFQMHILFNCNEDLWENCKYFDFDVSLTVLEKLEEAGENEKMSSFCDILLAYIWENDIVTSTIEKMTNKWCEIKLSGSDSASDFLSYIKMLLSKENDGPSSVTHYLILMQVIWEMIGDVSREVCVDILMCALRFLSDEEDNDNSNKIKILETIAKLLPKSTVCRLCLLCVFYLEPCIDTYYCLSDAYNNPLNTDSAKGTELRTELMLYIQKQFPSGSDIQMTDWNQINEQCLSKLSPEDVTFLLNEGKSPDTNETASSGADQSPSPPRSEVQQDDNNVVTEQKSIEKCELCTTEKLCESCKEKKIKLEKPHKKSRKKKRYGWTCPVVLCNVMSGRMNYLCTHLKSKHNWHQEEIRAFVKSLGVTRSARWTSTSDNLVLLHKAQLRISEEDNGSPTSSNDSTLLRQSSVESVKNVMDADIPIGEVQAETLSNEKTRVKDCFVKNSGSVGMDKKLSGSSEVKTEVNNNATNTLESDVSTSSKTHDLALCKKAAPIESMDAVMEVDSEVTKKFPDSQSDEDLLKNEVGSVVTMHTKNFNESLKQSSSDSVSHHKLGRQRKSKSGKKVGAPSKSKNLLQKDTPTVRIDEQSQVTTYKVGKSSVKPVNDLSTPLPPAIISSEKSKSIRHPGYVCPIGDCGRIFQHKHTIVAHIKFRHRRSQTVSETLAETAKEAVVKETEKVVSPDKTLVDNNMLLSSRMWYLRVDEFIHEEIEDKPSDTGGNTEPRTFLIECVRTLFENPLTNFNYNAACKYLQTSWHSLTKKPSKSEPFDADSMEDAFSSVDFSFLESNNVRIDQGASLTSKTGTPVISVNETEHEEGIQNNANNRKKKSTKLKTKKILKSTPSNISDQSSEVNHTPTDKNLPCNSKLNSSPTVMTRLSLDGVQIGTDVKALKASSAVKVSKPVQVKKPNKESLKKYQSKVSSTSHKNPKEMTTDRSEVEQPKSEKLKLMKPPKTVSVSSVAQKTPNKNISFEEALADVNTLESTSQTRPNKKLHKLSSDLASVPTPTTQKQKRSRSTSSDSMQKLKHSSAQISTTKHDENPNMKTDERKKRKIPSHRKHSLDSKHDAATSEREFVGEYSDLIKHAERIVGTEFKSDLSSAGQIAEIEQKAPKMRHSSSGNNSRPAKSQVAKKIKNKLKRSIDLRKLSSNSPEDEVSLKTRKTEKDRSRNNPLENLLSESSSQDSNDVPSHNESIKNECHICGRLMANGFALACHMRKKHKSKAKMFIPDRSPDATESVQRTKNSKLGDKSGLTSHTSKHSKNAEPVHKEGHSSKITCAQANFMTLPTEEFLGDKPSQIRWLSFSNIFYSRYFREELERKQDSIIKTNVYKLISTFFLSSNGKYCCLVPECKKRCMAHPKSLRRHMKRNHIVSVSSLLKIARSVVETSALRRCSGCLEEFSDFEELENHAYGNAGCKKFLKDSEIGIFIVTPSGNNLDLQCYLCTNKFSNLRSLTDHLFRIHDRSRTDVSTSKEFLGVSAQIENILLNRLQNRIEVFRQRSSSDETSESDKDFPEELNSLNADKRETDESLDVGKDDKDVEKSKATESSSEMDQDSEEDKVVSSSVGDLSMETSDSFSSADDSQSIDIHDSDASLYGYESIPQSGVNEQSTDNISVSPIKGSFVLPVDDNHSVSDESFVLSDNNVSSEADMDVSEEAGIAPQTPISEKRSLRRLAYTQATRKIAMKSPETFNRRKWAEFQNLQYLYNKRALKKVAQSLAPAKKNEISSSSSLESTSAPDGATMNPTSAVSDTAKPNSTGSDTMKPTSTGSNNSIKRCWLCKDGFKRLDNYISHIIFHLRTIDRFENLCDFPGCLYAFRTEEELDTHQLLHEGAVNICLFCASDSCFSSADDLLEHEKKHHTDVVNILSILREKFCINKFRKPKICRKKGKGEKSSISPKHRSDDNEHFLCCSHRKRSHRGTENENNDKMIKESGHDIKYCDSIALQGHEYFLQSYVCDIITDVLDTLEEVGCEYDPSENDINVKIEMVDDNRPTYSILNDDNQVAVLKDVNLTETRDITFPQNGVYGNTNGNSIPESSASNLTDSIALSLQIEVADKVDDCLKVSNSNDEVVESSNLSESDKISNNFESVAKINQEPDSLMYACQKIIDLAMRRDKQNECLNAKCDDVQRESYSTIAIVERHGISDSEVQQDMVDCNKDACVLPLSKSEFEMKELSFDTDNDADHVESTMQIVPIGMISSFLDPHIGGIGALISKNSHRIIEHDIILMEVASTLERVLTHVESSEQCDALELLGVDCFLGLLPMTVNGVENAVIASLPDESTTDIMHSENLLFDVGESNRMQTETTITILPDEGADSQEIQLAKSPIKNTILCVNDDEKPNRDMILNKASSLDTTSNHAFSSNTNTVMLSPFGDTNCMPVSNIQYSNMLERMMSGFAKKEAILSADKPALGWNNDTVLSAVISTPAMEISTTSAETSTLDSDSVTGNIIEKVYPENTTMSTTVNRIPDHLNPVIRIKQASIDNLRMMENSQIPKSGKDLKSSEKVFVKKSCSISKSRNTKHQIKSTKQEKNKKHKKISILKDSFRKFRGRYTNHVKHLEPVAIPDVWQADDEIFLKMFPSLSESVQQEKSKKKKLSSLQLLSDAAEPRSIPPKKRVKRSHSCELASRTNSETLLSSSSKCDNGSTLPRLKKLGQTESCKQKRRRLHSVLSAIQVVKTKTSTKSERMPLPTLALSSQPSRPILSKMPFTQNLYYQRCSWLLEEFISIPQGEGCEYKFFIPAICGICQQAVQIKDMLEHVLQHALQSKNHNKSCVHPQACLFKYSNHSELSNHHHTGSFPLFCLYCCLLMESQHDLDLHENKFHVKFQERFRKELVARLKTNDRTNTADVPSQDRSLQLLNDVPNTTELEENSNQNQTIVKDFTLKNETKEMPALQNISISVKPLAIHHSTVSPLAIHHSTVSNNSVVSEPIAQQSQNVTSPSTIENNTSGMSRPSIKSPQKTTKKQMTTRNGSVVTIDLSVDEDGNDDDEYTKTDSAHSYASMSTLSTSNTKTVPEYTTIRQTLDARIKSTSGMPKCSLVEKVVNRKRPIILSPRKISQNGSNDLTIHTVVTNSPPLLIGNTGKMDSETIPSTSIDEKDTQKVKQLHTGVVKFDSANQHNTDNVSEASSILKLDTDDIGVQGIESGHIFNSERTSSSNITSRTMTSQLSNFADSLKQICTEPTTLNSTVELSSLLAEHRIASKIIKSETHTISVSRFRDYFKSSSLLYASAGKGAKVRLVQSAYRPSQSHCAIASSSHIFYGTPSTFSSAQSTTEINKNDSFIEPTSMTYQGMHKLPGIVGDVNTSVFDIKQVTDNTSKSQVQSNDVCSGHVEQSSARTSFYTPNRKPVLPYPNKVVITSSTVRNKSTEDMKKIKEYRSSGTIMSFQKSEIPRGSSNITSTKLRLPVASICQFSNLINLSSSISTERKPSSLQLNVNNIRSSLSDVNSEIDRSTASSSNSSLISVTSTKEADKLFSRRHVISDMPQNRLPIKITSQVGAFQFQFPSKPSSIARKVQVVKPLVRSRPVGKSMPQNSIESSVSSIATLTVTSELSQPTSTREQTTSLFTIPSLGQSLGRRFYQIPSSTVRQRVVQPQNHFACPVSSTLYNPGHNTEVEQHSMPSVVTDSASHVSVITVTDSATHVPDTVGAQVMEIPEGNQNFDAVDCTRNLFIEGEVQQQQSCMPYSDLNSEMDNSPASDRDMTELKDNCDIEYEDDEDAYIHNNNIQITSHTSSMQTKQETLPEQEKFSFPLSVSNQLSILEENQKENISNLARSVWDAKEHHNGCEKSPKYVKEYCEVTQESIREIYKDLKAYSSRVSRHFRPNEIEPYYNCPISKCMIKQHDTQYSLYCHLCNHSMLEVVSFLQARYRNLRNRRLKSKQNIRTKRSEVKKCRFEGCSAAFQTLDSRFGPIFRSHMRKHTSKTMRVGDRKIFYFDSYVKLRDISNIQPETEANNTRKQFVTETPRKKVIRKRKISSMSEDSNEDDWLECNRNYFDDDELSFVYKPPSMRPRRIPCNFSIKDNMMTPQIKLEDSSESSKVAVVVLKKLT
uniref:uncharacterized protein LOC120346223 isoform X2 n=1 Tax=Styela clava TaxID=7725 RepID=UPI00193A207A|nr:uncharacterized protein LOC120346223 isoform X2 [Styela clava]